MLLEEVREVDIVATGRAGAQPLRVANDQIIGVAMGVELGEGLRLEVGPGCGFDRDLDAGFLLVLVAEFLQIIGRIPFRLEDGERLFLRVYGRSAGKR